MTLPVIMHINYCEQGQSLAEACAKAVKWGFDGVEFRRRRAGDTDPVQYLDELARAVERSGLKQVIFGSPGPDLMTTDAGVRARELEEAERFFRLAAERFRLTVCNTFSGSLVNPNRDPARPAYDQNGSACATPDQWAQATDGFKQLGAVAGELGFRLAFETHMNYLHDTPAAARALVDRIDHPAVGINLDYGNAVYFQKPQTLDAALTTAGERTYYVHLKNSIRVGAGARVPVGLADGEINHRAYLRRLREIGYAGPIGIEAPRPGDREAFAQADLA
ncbi:MAG TPA: sugar phosphate isomerase/epimerase family protein, partial [Limnochordia bacterium]|nr:sugar phosphate isomerase/epimerase family protein [Limnochordia bacterium]